MVAGEQGRKDFVASHTSRSHGTLLQNSPRRSSGSSLSGKKKRSSSPGTKKMKKKSHSMDKLHRKKEYYHDENASGTKLNATWDSSSSSSSVKRKKSRKKDSRRQPNQAAIRSKKGSDFDFSSSESDSSEKLRKMRKKKKKHGNKKSNGNRRKRDNSRSSRVSDIDETDGIISPLPFIRTVSAPKQDEEDSSIDCSYAVPESQEHISSLPKRGAQSEGHRYDSDEDSYDFIAERAGASAPTSEKEYAKLISDLERENTEMQLKLNSSIAMREDYTSKPSCPITPDPYKKPSYQRFMKPSLANEERSDHFEIRKTPVMMSNKKSLPLGTKAVLSENDQTRDMLAQLEQEVKEIERRAQAATEVVDPKPVPGPPLHRRPFARRGSLTSVNSTRSLIDLQAEVTAITAKASSKTAPLKSAMKGASRQSQNQPDVATLLQIHQSGNAVVEPGQAFECLRPPLTKSQSVRSVRDMSMGHDTHTLEHVQLHQHGQGGHRSAEDRESPSGYSSFSQSYKQPSQSYQRCSQDFEPPSARPQMTDSTRSRQDSFQEMVTGLQHSQQPFHSSYSVTDVTESQLETLSLNGPLGKVAPKGDPSGHSRATKDGFEHHVTENTVKGSAHSGNIRPSRDPDLDGEDLNDVWPNRIASGNSGNANATFKDAEAQCCAMGNPLSSGSCFNTDPTETDILLATRCDPPDMKTSKREAERKSDHHKGEHAASQFSGMDSIGKDHQALQLQQRKALSSTRQESLQPIAATCTHKTLPVAISAEPSCSTIVSTKSRDGNGKSFVTRAGTGRIGDKVDDLNSEEAPTRVPVEDVHHKLDNDNWLLSYIAGTNKSKKTTAQIGRSIDPGADKDMTSAVKSRASRDPPHTIGHHHGQILVGMEKEDPELHFMQISFHPDDQDLISTMKNPSCFGSKSNEEEDGTIVSDLDPFQEGALVLKAKKEDSHVKRAMKSFDAPSCIEEEPDKSHPQSPSTKTTESTSLPSNNKSYEFVKRSSCGNYTKQRDHSAPPKPELKSLPTQDEMHNENSCIETTVGNHPSQQVKDDCTKPCASSGQKKNSPDAADPEELGRTLQRSSMTRKKARPKQKNRGREQSRERRERKPVNLSYVPNQLQSSSLNVRLRDLKERKRLLEGENKLRRRNRSADGLRRVRKHDKRSDMKKQRSVGTLTVRSSDSNPAKAAEQSPSAKKQSDEKSIGMDAMEDFVISIPAENEDVSRLKQSQAGNRQNAATREAGQGAPNKRYLKSRSSLPDDYDLVVNVSYPSIKERGQATSKSIRA
eukprot:scaffold4061_cov108-Cylindrotheca_fusiformis.AAC.11